MLRGAKGSSSVSKYISQPYHAYLPNPGYLNGEILQHNNSGFRGTEVSLQKTNKYRILCLGGSTTYGFGVKDPSQSYPAQLEEILNDWHRNNILQLAAGGVEVINGGLEAGTSAEELTQYLFKYRYYKPDMIIIHSGGNDAQIDPENPNFQPDYSHYRRLLFHLEPLPAPTRYLMNSHFISFLTIQLFYSDFSNSTNYFSHFGEQQFTHWMDNSLDKLYLKSDYSYYPFYKNHLSLVRTAVEEGSKVIDLSFALDYNHRLVKEYPSYGKLTDLNNEIINSISSSENIHYLPFHYDSIKNPDYWLDDCHLTSEGEKMKAEMVARKIALVYE